MENVIHRLTLDLTGPDTIPRVEVQQDNARSLSISLTQGGRPYWIAEGVTAVFSARKPDGMPLFNACTIEKNRVVYDFTDQTTNVAGIVECEILLYSGDERILASPRFELAIDELIHKDGDVPESAPQISALTQMVAAGTAMIEDLREALGELEGVEEILTQARAAAEAASGSEAAARGHAKTAADAAADAQTLAGQVNSATQQANKYAYEARQSAQSTAADREAAENAAADAEAQAQAAEESAKRAEEAAAGAGGGGISSETVEMMITGHNSNRNSHEDIRQYVQRNGDEIAALGRDKLDADALPEAINTALAQAQATGAFKGADGADGRGIKSVARTFGNGAAGTVDTYTITYTDGTKSTYQVRNGKNGADGIGISGTEINENGELVITYSNNETVNLGRVVGEGSGGAGIPGKDGVGISKTEINGEGHLVITYTDGKTVDLGNVIGAPGADGSAATVAIVGATAIPAGSDPSVTEAGGSTAQNRKYILGIPRGAQGPAGADGKDGSPGKDGATGPQGPRGDSGVHILADGETLADVPPSASVVIDPRGDGFGTQVFTFTLTDGSIVEMEVVARVV